jgi:hypothetical protein
VYINCNVFLSLAKNVETGTSLLDSYTSEQVNNSTLFLYKSKILAVVGKVTVTPLQSNITSYFLEYLVTFSLHFK